jgi:hypothetical protein
LEARSTYREEITKGKLSFFDSLVKVCFHYPFSRSGTGNEPP